MTKPLLDVLQGKTPEHMPVWLMRQAGRYLPEYRELRAKAKNFLNLCLTPEWATEITLQPIRRFGMDGAILFADILLVPMALGLSLDFREGEGPILECVTDQHSIERLSYNNGLVHPVYETLTRIKPQLPDHTTLIGFCGAPWTVACYMIDGNSKNDFAQAKQWASQQPELLDSVIQKLVDASARYLCKQVEAGAEALQIFDSWAGLITDEAAFRRFVIEPTRTIVSRVKAQHPYVPIIGFPREAWSHYKRYIRETGVDAMSVDHALSLSTDGKQLQAIKPLQGNLSPDLLVQGGAAMKRSLDHIYEQMGLRHIMNLGHGVVPQTPPEHVADLVKHTRGFKA